MCVSDMPALARFHTTARCRRKALQCCWLGAFGQVCLIHSNPNVSNHVCIFNFLPPLIYNKYIKYSIFVVELSTTHTRAEENKSDCHVSWNKCKFMRCSVLVPRLSSPTPLFPLVCVHPRKHMLTCVAVLWRTQSTSYPQLSLVTVSGLCGRTGSDRMDCCVIDFNLESAACCFFPPFLS